MSRICFVAATMGDFVVILYSKYFSSLRVYTFHKHFYKFSKKNSIY